MKMKMKIEILCLLIFTLIFSTSATENPDPATTTTINVDIDKARKKEPPSKKIANFKEVVKDRDFWVDYQRQLHDIAKSEGITLN